MEHSIILEHSLMVAKLSKPGKQIMEELDPQKIAVLHMAVGISGEAGELLDAIKKHTIYNKPFAEIATNIIEELGDIEFYLEGLRQLLGVSYESTLKANVEKLSIRYKNFVYSNEAAEKRADKA